MGKSTHPAHEAVSSATTLEQREGADVVGEAMNKLPVEFREILVLRHLVQLSYNEIADIAQLAPGTIMSRLVRAGANSRRVLALARQTTSPYSLRD
jgi:RNA polymerase sigma factor (sigma-70 family)